MGQVKFIEAKRFLVLNGPSEIGMCTLQKRAIYEFESFGRELILENPFIIGSRADSTKICGKDFVSQSPNIPTHTVDLLIPRLIIYIGYLHLLIHYYC